MARKKTPQELKDLTQERATLNHCTGTHWCSCIHCFNERNPQLTMTKPKPYNALSYLEDLLEDSGYNPLEYFNK